MQIGSAGREHDVRGARRAEHVALWWSAPSQQPFAARAGMPSTTAPDTIATPPPNARERVYFDDGDSTRAR